ncbi:hypothetical protein [Herbaspirillum sp. YR522]|nr:hypothetical protein [Herbaspirillum sp. YR522]EJN09358.1 hypothetical protein PMI40_00805 [Herbaspirillum sp. YR522]
MRTLLLVAPMTLLVTLYATAEPVVHHVTHTVNWHGAFFGF